MLSSRISIDATPSSPNVASAPTSSTDIARIPKSSGASTRASTTTLASPMRRMPHRIAIAHSDPTKMLR